MEIEQLSNLQLSSIKGGEWIYIAGEWYIFRSIPVHFPAAY